PLVCVFLSLFIESSVNWLDARACRSTRSSVLRSARRWRRSRHLTTFVNERVGVTDCASSRFSRKCPTLSPKQSTVGRPTRGSPRPSPFVRAGSAGETGEQRNWRLPIADWKNRNGLPLLFQS